MNKGQMSKNLANQETVTIISQLMTNVNRFDEQ